MQRGEVKGLDEVLEEIPLGRFHLIVVLVSGFAYFADGLVGNSIGFTSECIGDEYGLDDSSVAKYPTFLFCGSIVGTIVFAQLADIYGRRFTLLFAMAWIIIFFLFTSLLTTPGTIMFGYFLIGIGTGGTGIGFDYISEVVAPNLRVLSFAMQAFWPLSTTVVPLLGWWILGGGGTWRTLMQIMTIPAIAVFAFSYYMLPESARWLLGQDETDKAEDQVKEYAKMNGTHLNSFSFTRGMLKDTQRDEQEDSNAVRNTAAPVRLSAGLGNRDDEKSTMEKITYVFSEFWRKMMGILTDLEMRHSIQLMSYIFFNSCFSMYGAVFLQARLLESESEYETCNFDFAEYLLSAPAELIATLLIVFTTDMQGRRWSMFTWVALIALSSWVLFMSTANSVLASTALLGIRFSSVGSNVASWAPATELFNTEYRATAFAFCYVMSRVGAILAAFVVDSTLSTETVCVFLMIGSVLAAIAALSLKETRGRAIY